MRRFIFGLALFALAATLPPAVQADDREIAEQIVSQLQEEKDKGNLQGFNIDLKIDQGAVYLKGYVSERDQLRLAIDIARHAEGVKQVFNELEVRPAARPKSEPPAEPRKQNLAQRLLASQPKQPVGREEADEAESHSQVHTVSMEQPSRQTRDSRDIAEEIADQLKAEKDAGNLQGFGIDLEVDQGIVWLKGNVADDEQETLAVEIARHVRGVKQVVNALVVNDGSEPAAEGEADQGVQHAFRQDASPQSQDSRLDSSQIAQAVIGGLETEKRRGNLTDFGIDVQVDQRIVWMSGHVSSTEQLQRALDVARYTPGVEKVVNDLTIGQDESHTTAAAHVDQLAEPADEPNPLGLQQAAPHSPQPLEAVGQLANPAAPQAAPQGQQWHYAMVPAQYLYAQQAHALQLQRQVPLAFAPARPVNHTTMQPGQPMPIQMNAGGVGIAPARFDHPQMPGYAWPSYAAHPNYAAVTYPKQHSASAWPYIGPFYPYPQVPLGWRRVTLEWDDGWWQLKFKNHRLH